MSRTSIHFQAREFGALRRHLLPRGGACEEAAFLFTRTETTDGSTALSVIGLETIPPGGFTSQSRFHLELTDAARAGVIKRAHDLEAGLIECHSHPGQRRASFSWSDLRGFDDFVPHVRWRLGGRPYAAIVFATDSIDALVWRGASGEREPIALVDAGRRAIEPTGLTYTNWENIYDQRSL